MLGAVDDESAAAARAMIALVGLWLALLAVELFRVAPQPRAHIAFVCPALSEKMFTSFTFAVA